MKYMALDYGTKYIGIALSDGLQCMAFPKESIAFTSKKKVEERLLYYMQQEPICAFVVGYPAYRDGSCSPVAKQTLDFIQEFLCVYNLPIYLVNEYLTSSAAKAITKGKKERVDAYAASLILENFLLLSVEEKQACLFK